MQISWNWSLYIYLIEENSFTKIFWDSSYRDKFHFSSVINMYGFNSWNIYRRQNGIREKNHISFHNLSKLILSTYNCLRSAEDPHVLKTYKSEESLVLAATIRKVGAKLFHWSLRLLQWYEMGWLRLARIILAQYFCSQCWECWRRQNASVNTLNVTWQSISHWESEQVSSR